MKNDLLNVVAVYSNPIRWENRRKRHHEFEEHMLDSGVRLTTVECAFGERPFELEERDHVHRVRVRAKTLAWNKECLINIGISRIPEARYICTSDADIEFRRNGWASETVHALQHFDVVQPWVTAYDLGPHDEHIQAHKSFCYQFVHGKPVIPEGPHFWKTNGGIYEYPHSGYCWAYTRQALEWLGGLIDFACMGAGDHHMALAYVGAVDRSVPHGTTAAYMKHLHQWQSRAVRHINRNIGFVDGTIEHHWHGRKADRKYMDRWEIFVKNQFDPDTDIKKNTHGVVELSGNKPELSRELFLYYRARSEDANTLN